MYRSLGDHALQKEAERVDNVSCTDFGNPKWNKSSWPVSSCTAEFQKACCKGFLPWWANDLLQLVENLQGGGGGGDGWSDQHPESTCGSDVNSDLGKWFLSRSVQAGIKHADRCGRSTVIQVWIASIDFWPQEMFTFDSWKCMQLVKAITQLECGLVWKQFQCHPKAWIASAFVMPGLVGFAHSTCLLFQIQIRIDVLNFWCTENEYEGWPPSQKQFSIRASCRAVNYAQGKMDTETNSVVTVGFTTKVDHQTTSKISEKFSKLSDVHFALCIMYLDVEKFRRIYFSDCAALRDNEIRKNK